MNQKQKTWIDLLGSNPSDCMVCGQYITRKTTAGTFTVVWRADDRVMAQRILDQWKSEVERLREVKPLTNAVLFGPACGDGRGVPCRLVPAGEPVAIRERSDSSLSAVTLDGKHRAVIRHEDVGEVCPKPGYGRPGSDLYNYIARRILESPDDGRPGHYGTHGD